MTLSYIADIDIDEVEGGYRPSLTITRDGKQVSRKAPKDLVVPTLALARQAAEIVVAAVRLDLAEQGVDIEIRLGGLMIEDGQHR